ncbi:MAG TPA: S8 family serine peptidase [Dermatophilaceae bacterium]|nr:S8 family serine peptidase [Dermatophilaceae bacterium]
MQRRRMIGMTGAAALLAAGLGATAPANATTGQAGGSGASGTARSYVVLAKEGVSAEAVARKLTGAGATVTSVNSDVGMVTVSSTSSAFLAKARAIKDVEGAAVDGVVGRAPKQPKVDTAPTGRAAGRPAAKGNHGGGGAVQRDPLDSYLWGMDMIKAPQAHRYETGDRRVRVGVIDTGIQGDHPDLAAGFDRRLSRNFTTDMPDIDGPCEVASCVDPADVDDDGHGTHVAGTIAASLDGFGLSGVAPDVSLVNVRAGQDSGYFFLSPVVNALTYADDVGIDVVNMSFYVDPWLYNCMGGAPEDSPEAAFEQDLIIKGMNRALNFAHRKGVTLVAAAGNNHEDMANPRPDTSSPDYGPVAPYERTIDNETCFDLPVEGRHVLGVTSVGPSRTKADYSNYTTEPRSGEIEVAAPGGWFRDGFGTPSFRTNENLILSTAPLGVLQGTGEVDENGNITPDGEANGVMKQCTDDPPAGAQECGYYQYLQGTSMASPHATGVAALAVSSYGHRTRGGGFGLAPNAVRALVMRTATDNPCPPGGVRSYEQEGRSPEFTATCVGTTRFNGFYGDGIVNALGVVKRWGR